jgi:type IV pilus assembly protein PilW
MKRILSNNRRRLAAVTMVELMVALAIGSFLMIGALQVYTQSRQAFVINDSIARVQETAQFAMDTVEADLRMASNWGQHSRGSAIEGRAIIGDANPLNLLGVPTGCGADWALDVNHPLEGTDNTYTLPCATVGAAQANSDVITIRRATVAVMPLEAGRIQLQTTRIQGQIFNNATVPAAFDPAESETHNLLVNSYYVAVSSTLIPGVPTLRRKMLTMNGANAVIVDQDVAPGVENMPLQFGVDVDDDNTIDRYVNPGANIFDPTHANFIPAARVLTARVWLLVRSVSPEVGLTDTRDYEPGNVDLGVQNDENRRLLVSKTILLRNARS